MKRQTSLLITTAMHLLVAGSGLSAIAQETLQAERKAPLPTSVELTSRMDGFETRAFFLKNATSLSEAEQILVAVRQMIRPLDKAFLDSNSRTIVLRADADDLALAGKLIEALDRPRKNYRLTYTFIDKEGSRQVGQQHVSLIIVAGQRTQMKGGDRLPIAVKSASADGTKAPEVTYIDVGVNVDVTGDEVPNGLRLRSKVERTTAAEERSSAVSGDPILRQSVLEDTALVPLMKPMQLGTLDVPGSTRTVEVSVTAEPL